MNAVVCFALVLTVLDLGLGLNAPLVTLSTGQIQGRNIENQGLAFQSVPYAAKPIGTNRFMPPQSVSNWTNVLNTTQYSAICPQWAGSEPNMFLLGSEDCLYLNVFTPNVNGNLSKWPVFVWIHGGGYTTGSGTRFTELAIINQFVSKNIVVVTINYRLNSLGYFTTNITGGVQANLGMLDQIYALQWVQREIGAFGGDANRVTIGGESAGSASVSLHMHSPMTNGLFNQAVMESGTWRCAWALDTLVPINSNMSISGKFAVATGCISAQDWTNQQYGGLRQCLQNLPFAQIMNVTNRVQEVFGWSPVVGGPFMPTSPSHLPVNSSVNVLMGTNRDEWAFETLLFRQNMSLINAFGPATFESRLRMNINSVWAGPGYKVIADLARHKYSAYPGFDNTSLSWYWAGANFLSDSTINSGAVGEATYLQRNKNTVFLYSFDYASPGFWGSDNVTAVTHFTDVIYLFPGVKGAPAGYTFDAMDKNISNTLGSYWSNFVLSGNPNQPANASGDYWNAMDTNAQFMSISNPPSMKMHFRDDVQKFWNILVPRVLRDMPVVTCPTPANAATGKYQRNIVLIILALMLKQLLFI